MIRRVTFTSFLLLCAVTGVYSQLATNSDWKILNLDNPAAQGSSVPRLSVVSGVAALSWIEASPNGQTFRFSTWNGSRWSTVRTIASGPGILAAMSSEPGILDAGNGLLAAQWLTKAEEKEANHILVAVSSNGGDQWSTPVKPYRDTTAGEHMYVSLFPWPSGGAGVVWLDPRGEKNTELIQTTLDRSGKLGAEHTIQSDVCSCCPTSSAVTDAGPVVMYRNRTASDIRDMYLTTLSNGEFKPGHAIHDDGWQINGCPTNAGTLAASGKTVAATWFTGAGGAKRVKVAFSQDGGATFGNARTIDESNPVGRASLALLKDGSALVAWVGNGNKLRVRQAWPDGTLGSEISLAKARPQGKLGFPFISPSGSGAMVVWTDWDEKKSNGIRTALLARGEHK